MKTFVATGADRGIRPCSIDCDQESHHPLERADRARPEGRFVTSGVGVPLMDMQSLEVARAVVPVD